ncbi:MAG: protein kinase [Myxococcota bacterium]
MPDPESGSAPKLKARDTEDMATPRRPRNTVLGSPGKLAQDKGKAFPPPPPAGKLPSGRHKTITNSKTTRPEALTGQPQSQQQTVVGPAPTEAKPSMRRGTGEYIAAESGGEESGEQAKTLVPGSIVQADVAAVTGATVVPGSVTRDDLVAPGGTVVPGAVSREEVLAAAASARPNGRPTAPVLRPEHVPPDAEDSPLPVADPPSSPASPVEGRPQTQPMDPDAEPSPRPFRETDEFAARQPTTNTRGHVPDLDAWDRRRGTHFHGAQGLVDAGSESPKLRLVPGKVIPGTRYKILRWLGEGGMGVVYEAAHVDIERKSALKILRFDLSQQPKMVQVFRDEARAASRLGSPHIVEIYDFGELPDGRLFFAMELLDGHDLVPTEDDPVIAPGRLIGMLRQVCKGLAAAHDAGVVHRDVKPENIIIADTDERRDVAKIVDFGISSMLAAGDGDGGGIAGTPHYMAPEQILGDRFDGRLDVYALGATAYELLVGQPPFDADEVEDILQMQVSQSPAAPRTVRPELDLPAELESVILKCLAKNADQRYPNMGELEAALCEAQIAAGLVTPWDDLAVPELPDAERRARIIARMPNAPAPASKRGMLWPIVAGAATLAAVGIGAFAFMRAAPTDDELSIVEQLTAEAQEAAADQSWVVPTAMRPDGTTAYKKVLELEAVEGPAEEAADERGEELRLRFSSSLIGSADKMWDQGAKILARQFYLYAWMFDENNAHAFDRIGMPTTALAHYVDNAKTGNFDAEEMLVAAFAAAEAEQNPEKKKVLQEEAAQQSDEASEESPVMLAAVTKGSEIGQKVRARPKRGSGAPTPAPVPTPEAVPDPFADGGETPPTPDADEPVIEEAAPEQPKSRPKVRPKPRPKEQDAGTLLGTAKRDPARAAELAKEGMSALKSGQRGKATSLFNQAIAFDRKNAKALMGLSDVYFDTGSNQKAVNYAEKAVGAAPKSGRYRIKLGDAYFKVLRYQDAKKQYQKAKDLGASRADERLKKVAAKLGG